MKNILEQSYSTLITNASNLKNSANERKIDEKENEKKVVGFVLLFHITLTVNDLFKFLTFLTGRLLERGVY